MAKKKPKRSKRHQNRRNNRLPQLDSLGTDVPIKESINVSLSEDTLLMEDESLSYERSLEMHPQLLELSRAGKLPDEATDENGEVWSVTMHLHIHATLENQLAQNKPEGIAELALKMEAEGILGAHEVRHVIMNSLANSIWKVQRDKVPFDDQAYMADIDESYRLFCDARK